MFALSCKEYASGFMELVSAVLVQFLGSSLLHEDTETC
jgi:hypothetical protein